MSTNSSPNANTIHPTHRLESHPRLAGALPVLISILILHVTFGALMIFLPTLGQYALLIPLLDFLGLIVATLARRNGQTILTCGQYVWTPTGRFT